MTDFRALCAELLDWAEVTAAHYIVLPEVMLRARAALADGPAVPDGREPASVTGQPRPVPVSERLPGPEDCLDEGWAWFFSPRVGWRQAVFPVSTAYTHWLPAHALPIPQQQQQENTNDH